MSETGLLVAEVAFLVLLYAFVWSVVRSSSRQLRASQPPPPMVVSEAPAEPAAPPAPAAAVPSAPAPPPPVAVPVAAAAASEAPTQLGDEDSGAFDIGAHLDPRLIVEESPSLEQGRVVALDRGITIGRSEAADLPIVDQFVSHMHARILRRGAYHFVEDLGSTNGTFLNDRRIEKDAALKVHDSLRIGQTTLRYEE
jgi:hypothetical protein